MGHEKTNLEFYLYHVGKGRSHWKIEWFVHSLDEREVKVMEILKGVQSFS